MTNFTKSFLLCLALLTGAFQSRAQNLINNGSFEQKYVSWQNLVGTGAVATYTLDSLTPLQGKYAMEVIVTTAGPDAYTIQSLHDNYNTTPGNDYKISLYAKASASGLGIRVVNQQPYTGKDLSLTDQWQQFTWTYTPAQASVQFALNFPYAGTFYIDSISITPVAVTPPNVIKDSLKVLAANCGLDVGTAVGEAPLEANETYYISTLKQHYNIVVPENAMKMSSIKTSELGDYDFTDADRLVAFAQANKMKVRGHTLIWHNQIPSWVTDKTWTNEELFDYLHTYIDTVVSHFKGKIKEWDVVNEAVGDAAGNALRDSFYVKQLGVAVFDSAFKWAHAADPNALLFYNDYNGEARDAKSDAVFALVSGLLERKAPINGVGMQSHRSYNEPASFFTDFDSNIKRIAALGLKVSVTELDVPVPVPVDPSNFTIQASTYANILRVVLKNKSTISTFITWGFTDKYSWIPSVFPTKGDALPFDSIYNAKPAFDSLASVFKTNCQSLTPVDQALTLTTSVLTYPNPFTETTTFVLPGKFEYTVYDVRGAAILQGKGSDAVEIGAELKSGMYTIVVNNGASSKTVKIIKQ